MLARASLADVSGLHQAWSEWDQVNWVRSLLFLIASCSLAWH
jgi:hypothetical protein